MGTKKVQFIVAFFAGLGFAASKTLKVVVLVPFTGPPCQTCRG
jgi:hypothetical protein